MADDFSQSLTPPVSPFAADSLCELPPTQPPCFCCSETKDDPARSLHADGYVYRGALKRLLLRLDPAPSEYETDTVEIFGFPWVTETALVESTKLLFGLFRQRIYRLESLVQSSSRDFGKNSGNLHYEAEDLKKQCVTFLQYIKIYLHSVIEAGSSHPFEEVEAQFPSALLEELFGITLLIGRLKDLSANIQSAFTIQNQGKIFPPSWHLLHLHLDIHWSILEILHLLGLKMQGQVVYAHQFVNLTGENLTDTSLFEEHLCSLLCDLTGLAMGKYSKVRPTETLNIHHYPCPCIKELWILLMHLLENRSKVLHTQSFWNYMNSLLRPLVTGKPTPDQFDGLPTHCKDPLGFTWWLVTHSALLGQYSRIKQFLKYGYFFKRCALSHIFSQNSSFTVPWLGVSGLGALCKSPLALLEQARSCCCPSPLYSPGHTQLYHSANSFHIFLRILALCLSQDRAGGVPQRQIKGRIYSKFSSKKMQELSEAGLMNFLLLFIVVAKQVELEDVAGRACELLDFLPSNCPPGHRTLVWRGQLTLLLLFQRGLDVGAQASWLASSFNETAKEFYNKTTEMSRKLALWGPLGSYLEGVAEVFETSTSLSLSEDKLLNEGFDWLLPACRQSDLNSALGFLQTVLAQRVHHRSVHLASNLTWAPAHTSIGKERHLAVASALWTHFFPFLRGLRLSQTPPAQLADAAAGFTLLAFDLPGTAPQDLQPSPVQSIMQCFGWDDMVHPLLVTRYLPHVLQISEVVAALSRESSSGSASGQSLSVRAWFRCVLQQHLHKNQDGTDSRTGELCILKFLSLLLSFSCITLNCFLSALFQPEQWRNSCSVGIAYSRIQVLSERSVMITRALDYIGDIFKHIKPSLVSKNPEALQLTYWAVGCIVKHWSPLLATSKAQQLLFRIVDGLLLPHNVMQQDKALRDSLPLYLQGLSVASSVSQSQGAYMKQQLRSVTRRYLNHFLPASPSIGAIANHPVLLGACEASPTPRGAALRRTILDFKGYTPPPRLATVLMFLLELLRRNRDTDPALLTLPLPAVLRSLMLVNEVQVRTTSTDALQLVVERCAAASAEGPCEQMITVLRSFVEENEGVYDRQIYSVLETVAVLDPAVVQALIPNLSLSLRNTEHKRGLGKNTTLRSAYKKLLCLLGESGQAEITSLEED
uniref:Protein MMS22-like n=1 Tax=Neogobius melanostomus TaxID=47308 RepID=A0A8C6X080_9GOBI